MKKSEMIQFLKESLNSVEEKIGVSDVNQYVVAYGYLTRAIEYVIEKCDDIDE